MLLIKTERWSMNNHRREVKQGHVVEVKQNRKKVKMASKSRSEEE